MTTITVIVGSKKYKPTADYTATENITYYPFTIAAFIPTPLSMTAKPYRRVMAYLLGQPQIKAKLHHLERNFTVNQLLNHFKRRQIYFALATDGTELQRFITQHPNAEINLLLLGKKAWRCATKFAAQPLVTIYTFPDPGKKDSFWRSLDYQDDSNLTSTSAMQKLAQPKIRL
ncbi:hypothetical protein [Loigolactobacillus jiayinensis]|uniref:Uncharacterized protein n=1 Tax=Loigolactobacillus jiayinensis TaxID=2486016 RepID=A0ABW1RCR9_9LACO|nr:hypothetical protein [Loigolactobacillus jiayinensis]